MAIDPFRRGSAARVFLRFCLVGTLGFVVDSGLVVIFTGVGVGGPFVARLLSFLVAAAVTWALNRRFTFGSSASAASFFAYLLLTGAGAGINIAVYMLWVNAFGSLPHNLVAGVAIGSVVALAFNFLVSRHIVFKQP